MAHKVAILVVGFVIGWLLVACQEQKVTPTTAERKEVEATLGKTLQEAIATNKDAVIQLFSAKLNAHVKDVQIIDGIPVITLVPMAQEIAEKAGGAAINTATRNPAGGIGTLGNSLLAAVLAGWSVVRTRSELAKRSAGTKEEQPA